MSLCAPIEITIKMLLLQALLTFDIVANHKHNYNHNLSIIYSLIKILFDFFIVVCTLIHTPR